MLETWAPGKKVKHPTSRYEFRLACTDTFCRYYLGVWEGSKRTDYNILPQGVQQVQHTPVRLRKTEGQAEQGA
ncbi:MAG: hypothetical protein B6U76_05875 [Desulfurococcales archaeon ex4484_217_2]|nr:MAG: hypothetical protein B6U76_05875 [Desulfurococcales archaeon ex4484_217_2]